MDSASTLTSSHSMEENKNCCLIDGSWIFFLCYWHQRLVQFYYFIIFLSVSLFIRICSAGVIQRRSDLWTAKQTYYALLPLRLYCYRYLTGMCGSLHEADKSKFFIADGIEIRREPRPVRVRKIFESEPERSTKSKKKIFVILANVCQCITICTYIFNNVTIYRHTKLMVRPDNTVFNDFRFDLTRFITHRMINSLLFYTSTKFDVRIARVAQNQVPRFCNIDRGK